MKKVAHRIHNTILCFDHLLGKSKSFWCMFNSKPLSYFFIPIPCNLFAIVSASQFWHPAKACLVYSAFGFHVISVHSMLDAAIYLNSNLHLSFSKTLTLCCVPSVKEAFILISMYDQDMGGERDKALGELKAEMPAPSRATRSAGDEEVGADGSVCPSCGAVAAGGDRGRADGGRRGALPVHHQGPPHAAAAEVRADPDRERGDRGDQALHL